MIEFIKRTSMNEFDDPPDGEVAELVTRVRVYGNDGGWREGYWNRGEVGVSVPRYPSSSLDQPGEFHHYPKKQVFLVSPQKDPADLERMLADAYLDNPDLERLHKAEQALYIIYHAFCRGTPNLHAEVMRIIRGVLKDLP